MKYFTHDTNSRENRKLWKVIKTHGMTGYGIWWALLEELYQAEDNGFCINADDLWLERFADDLRLSDYRTLVRVFDTFAEVGLIDKQLWQEHTLFVSAVIERGDRYVQRKAATKERVAKHRAELKKARDEMKRVGNALQVQSNALDPKYAEAEAEAEAYLKNKNEDQRSQEANSIGRGVQPELPLEIFDSGESSRPLDESLNSSPGQPAKVKNRGRAKSSAAAPISFEKFQQVWNDHKPASFAGLAVVNDRRQKVIRELVADCGGEQEALDVLLNALSFAAGDAWYQTKKMDFENFASNGKIVRLHERYISQAGTGGGGVKSEADLRLMATFQRFATYMNIEE